MFVEIYWNNVSFFFSMLSFANLGVRQERPPHLRSGHIHPAMIERGRAIPNTQTVPIVGGEKPNRAQDAPQIIDGRVSCISTLWTRSN